MPREGSARSIVTFQAYPAERTGYFGLSETYWFKMKTLFRIAKHASMCCFWSRSFLARF